MMTDVVLKRYAKKLGIGLSESLKEDFRNMEKNLKAEIKYWREQATKNEKDKEV